MKEATHTPGPWYLDLDSEMPAILAGGRDGNEICLITARHYERNDDGEMVPFFTDEDYANGRLIEAAPKLLEAAKNVCGLLFSLENVPDDHPAYQALKEVIAKATGQ